MTFLNREPGKLIRKHLDSIQSVAVTGADVVRDIVAYIDGGERDAVQMLYGTRYARQIHKDKDGTTWESKRIDAAQAAIDAGLLEVVVLGVGIKIVRFGANLTRDIEFAYSEEAAEQDENGKDVESEALAQFRADIEAARETAGFLQRLGRVDSLSMWCESAGCLVQSSGAKMDYQSVSTDKMWIAFADTINDNGVDRAVNTMDIEEASVVVVQLGMVQGADGGVQITHDEDTGTPGVKSDQSGVSQGTQFKFVAFYPRSDKPGYEDGRIVRYTASNWYDIPEIGHKDAIEAGDNGEVLNPFTKLQDASGDMLSPEIPLALWYGMPDQAGGELLPTVDTLYQTDMELNLSACRALSAHNKAADGMFVVTTEVGSTPHVIDSIAAGVSQLPEGHSITSVSVSGSNARELMETVQLDCAYISESYGVAAYKTIVNQNAQVPSGEALKQLDKPENQIRQDRADLNNSGFERIFRIEKAVANINRGTTDYGKGIGQTVIVKPLTVEQPINIMVDVVRTLKELGLVDDVGAVKRLEGLFPEFEDSTDEQIREEMAKIVKPAPQGAGAFANFELEEPASGGLAGEVGAAADEEA
jgi:hypothetical protein